MRSVVAHIVSCILLAGISLMTSCREDEVIILAEYERLPLGDNSRADYAGLSSISITAIMSVTCMPRRILTW